MTDNLSRHFSGCLLALVAIAVLGLAGCSNKGGKIKELRGTVTYNGQPMRGWILRVVGSGSVSIATIQHDGSFIITDVVPGEVKVGVTEAPQGSGGPSTTEERKPQSFSLPAKYQDPETSGLKYTITADTKALPIEIR